MLENRVSQDQMDSMVPEYPTYSGWYAEGIPRSARPALATTLMLGVAGGRSASIEGLDTAEENQ